MLAKEKIDKILLEKSIDDINLDKLNKFSPRYREFANIITKSAKEYEHKKEKYYNFFNGAILINNINLKLYKQIFKDYEFNPFRDSEGEALAKFLFGDVVGGVVADAWDKFNEGIYQSGYLRRSFRVKKANVDILSKKLFWLQQLFELRAMKKRSALFAMDIDELVRYMGYTWDNTFSMIVAIYLEKDSSKALKNRVWSIFLGEDEIGLITTDLIKANLISKCKECHEMVAKLLLSAQREEGLRQSILEALDETSIDALKYIIKTILDNELYRFSSVARAVDVWFGFNWDSAKKATIKKILEFAYNYLENPLEIEKALKKSRNNLEIYVALWAKAVADDAVEANNLAVELIKRDKAKEKKILGFIFILESEQSSSTLSEWIYENFGSGDFVLDYYMLEALDKKEKRVFVEKNFEKILNIAQSIPKDGVELRGKVFEWNYLKVTDEFFYSTIIEYASEDILKILAKDISKLPSLIRENYVLKLFPKHALDGWYLRSLNNQKYTPLELDEHSYKREILHQILLDKNTTLLTTGLNVLRSIKLYPKEYELIKTLFKRKRKELRAFLINFVLKLSDEKLKEITNELLSAKDASMRLGGLEILVKLYEIDRASNYVKEQISNYKSQRKLSKSEEALLSKVEVRQDVELSFENGFGVIDYSKLCPLYELKDRFANISKDKNIFDSYINRDKIAKAINNLVALLNENKNYEYSYEGFGGEVVSTLISKKIVHKKQNFKDFSDEERFKLLPLYELWERWYRESNLNDIEMLVALSATTNNPYWYLKKPKKEIIEQFYPTIENLNIKKDNYYGIYDERVHEIIYEVLNRFCNKVELIEFWIDILESLITRYPNSENEYLSYLVCSNLDRLLSFKENELNTIYRLWRVRTTIYRKYFGKTDLKYDNEMVRGLLNLKMFSPIMDILLDSKYTCYLYAKGLINQHDFLYLALVSQNLFINMLEQKDIKCFKNTPKESIEQLYSTYQKLKNTLIEIELQRGATDTEVSDIVSYFSKIEGVEYFIKILAIIGKDRLNKHTLSNLLEKTVASKDDSYEQFQKGAKSLKLSKKRWLEIAMYLPQWANWIGKFINLDALKDAVWWFRAHSFDYYLDKNDEATIAKYSNISISDFQRGALDLDWFNRVYPKIGKANWSILTEYAKYSNGKHRLIKLYSQVILGEIKIREILKKVKEKRDKDYLRALGLVPLSKKSPQKDLLSRYNLLQTFLKESKQFGTQRRESEKNAVEIAMANLARVAGYSDPIRLTLAMETKATQEIMQNSILTIDDYTFKLEIDESAKAYILVQNRDKRQKSIPAKYKKDRAIKELAANKNYLKKQYSRVVKFLEDAMLQKEEFELSELTQLMSHPIVKPLLNKLVLLIDGVDIALFKDEKLVAFKDEKIEHRAFNSGQKAIIAHPYHLYKSKEWSALQKYAFDKKIVQPFKQIFRELYLITDDEKESATYSRRYEGHQIQPQKALSILKSRGWKLDYENGLEKLFAKDGYFATLYAMTDWLSPADVEAPTIEQIAFISTKDLSNIKLEDIDSVIFSEVMRDIDLVVSVAHVGGIDPETSHSTIQMRAILAKESARVLKLNNVEVTKKHILIKGELGDYAIHLGSGMVTKDGIQLSIIPIHSQHRGRVFLPFIDDDPKSAEIISKMKLLSQDKKIKDPTILKQIVGD